MAALSPAQKGDCPDPCTFSSGWTHPQSLAHLAQPGRTGSSPSAGHSLHCPGLTQAPVLAGPALPGQCKSDSTCKQLWKLPKQIEFKEHAHGGHSIMDASHKSPYNCLLCVHVCACTCVHICACVCVYTYVCVWVCVSLLEIGAASKGNRPRRRR